MTTVTSEAEAAAPSLGHVRPDDVDLLVLPFETIPMSDDDLPQVRDHAYLTEDDWAQVYRWQRAYRDGGLAGLSEVMDDLAEIDAAQHVRLMEAFWPETVRQALHDQFAEIGMDEGEIQLLLRKLQGRVRDN